jgi:hypothetical protein
MGDREIGRRELIELLGGMALLAACSSSSAKTRVPGSTGTTGSTASRGPGSPATFTLNGPAQPASKRITRAALTRFRDQYAGKWSGAWVEDGGGKGTAEASIGLDVVRRVATCSVAFDGPLLGGQSPTPTTYVVGVDQYDSTSDHAVATSPQLGRIAVTIDGFGHLQLRATDIPGHREISSVDIRAIVTPTAGNITYTIYETNGTTQRGALAATKGTTRPAFPSLDQASTATAFVSGDYAASLMTAATATRLLGQPCTTPEANGGRSAYAPGIKVSNAIVHTVADGLNGSGAVIEYSVYQATDAAAMRTFFQRYAGYRTVPNLGEAAAAFPPGTTPITILDVRKGRNSLDLNIVGGRNYRQPPQQQNDALYVAVARAIVANLP